MAWIEKRSKNRYRVVWDVGSPDNRERRMEYIDGWEEAKAFKSKIEVELNSGTYVEPSKITFGEYLDRWIEIHGGRLAPKTLRSYQTEIKNHMKPKLGSIPLSKLSPLHLQEYYAFLLNDGRAEIQRRNIKFIKETNLQSKIADKKELKKLNDKLVRAQALLDNMIVSGNGGLSSTSVAYQHRIIHKALDQAVKLQMVIRNVADAVEAPQPRKKEMQYMQIETVNDFLSIIKGSPDYPIIVAAIFTGMRQGELLGLRWEDIDFNVGTISVRQQLQYIHEKGYFFKEPKRESQRSIPMPLPLSSLLRQVRKEQETIKAIYEEAAQEKEGKNEYKDNDLVFCNHDGSPLDGTGVTKRFQKLCKRNEFPKMRFHDLRHTFATMARSAGVPIEDLQDLLGHADISTTKKIYTHVELEPIQKAMQKVSERIKIS